MSVKKESPSSKSDGQPNTSTGSVSAPRAAAAASSDPKKFEGEGVVIKSKLIGQELVIEPRGDKMCQNSIARLKAIIKGTNSHKKRIVLKISLDGIKVFDEKTNELLHHHRVPEISYIASDETDARTFGYVCDVPNNAHQFICFKTNAPAANAMAVINELFELVLEKKKSEQAESIVCVDNLITGVDDLVIDNTVPVSRLFMSSPPVMQMQAAAAAKSALSAKSSVAFASSAPKPALIQQDSTDRYAVFYDIDNMPSILDSASSHGSLINKQQRKPQQQPFRSSPKKLNNSLGTSMSESLISSKWNPFDDEFFN